jgi:hypothetical protein
MENFILNYTLNNVFPSKIVIEKKLRFICITGWYIHEEPSL